LPYEVYKALSDCETGSNLKHESLSYVGAFGFTKVVFRQYNPTGKPAAKMTYGEQAKTLDHAFFYGKRQPSGKFLWPVGAWGHGCWKQLWVKMPALRNAVCNNGKWQVRKQCRK